MKYGELIRFKENEYQYIIKVEKHFSDQTDDLYIPYFNVFITNKTSKKRGNKLSKDDRKYSLLDKNSIGTIKKIEKVIKAYLDTHKPKYIAIAAYKDNKCMMDKRFKFYVRRLNLMGYYIFKIDKETFVDPIYYMKRGPID